MPCLTVTEKPKTKPRFSHRLWHPARKWSGSILGHKTYTHAYSYSLKYLPQTHTGLCCTETCIKIIQNEQNTVLLL